MMKHSLKSIAAMALMVALFVGCGDVGDAPKAQTGDEVDVNAGAGQTLNINSSKSKIEWIGAKVTATHEGGFSEFDGTVSVEDGKVNNVTVRIQTASIYTTPDKLVEHLKTPDFFDAENNPICTFEASSFVPKTDSAGNTHEVSGNLTMAGTTHGVTFPAKITVAENMVTAEADFKVNRQDWGIKYAGAPDNLIRDDVRIMLNIVADDSTPAAAPAETGAEEHSEEAQAGE